MFTFSADNKSLRQPLTNPTDNNSNSHSDSTERPGCPEVYKPACCYWPWWEYCYWEVCRILLVHVCVCLGMGSLYGTVNQENGNTYSKWGNCVRNVCLPWLYGFTLEEENLLGRSKFFLFRVDPIFRICVMKSNLKVASYFPFKNWWKIYLPYPFPTRVQNVDPEFYYCFQVKLHFYHVQEGYSLLGGGQRVSPYVIYWPAWCLWNTLKRN